MSPKLNQALLDFVQASVDLADSVRNDAMRDKDRSVSETTIDFLVEFRKKHDGLEEVLNILNGEQ